jgi:endonuclease/exonuclease/phosphatase family metal-dependent hydrolase
VRRGAFVAIALVVGAVPGLVACSSGSSSTGGDGGGGRSARDATVTVLTQNLLHGTACAPESNRCDLPARVALFARQLGAARCPQLVGLQEANQATVDQLRAVLPQTCGGAYEVVWDDDPASDREVVLTTLPVLARERVHLAGPLRTALWVRVKAPVGPVDYVSTHLASGSDDRRCDAATCPKPCRVADTLNTCQARQAADLLDDRRSPRSVGILSGDLNATPGESTIAVLHDRGYVDAAVAAGSDRCTEADPSGCTGGRVDTSLEDMRNASSRQTERIDYVFLATRRDCDVRRAGVLQSGGGPVADDGLVYPSDHSGVLAEVECATTPADLAAARARPSTSTTTTTGAAVPPTTRAAVQAAFDTVFSNVEPDPARRVRALEDGAALRASFLARVQALGPLHTQARIDSMTAAGPDAVEVVYSILLDGNVVLDALPGRAIRAGDRWLVAKATYCQVASLGTDTAPEPCR